MLESLLLMGAGALSALTGGAVALYFHRAPRLEPPAAVVAEGGEEATDAPPGEKCNVRVYRFQGGEVALHQCKGITPDRMNERYAHGRLRNSMRIPGRLLEVRGEVHYVR